MNAIGWRDGPPRYAQVAATLRQEIEGVLKPGDILPAEPELEVRFGVSRITVRRAMQQLEMEGLVIRQQGRGTFVRKPPITQNLAELLSWTSSMRRMGLEPQTLRSEIELIEPPVDTAAKLDLSPGQLVVRISRVRGADDEPICLMTNYVPAQLAPNLASEGLKDDSVYATLIANGFFPTRVEDIVEARTAEPWEADLLQVPARAPLLEITRLSLDHMGRPLDIAIVSSRPDRYRYTVLYNHDTLSEKRQIVQPTGELNRDEQAPIH